MKNANWKAPVIIGVQSSQNKAIALEDATKYK